MSTNLIASLRQQLPSIYGEHLPDEIRYCRADGQERGRRFISCFPALMHHIRFQAGGLVRLKCRKRPLRLEA